MEDQSPFEPDPSERFIDAALREKSRLGEEGRDAELVHRILMETVHRPKPNTDAGREISGLSPSTFDLKLVLSGVSAVAALIALALIALNTLPFGSNGENREEYHFVVQSARPLVGSFQDEVTPVPPVIEPLRYSPDLTFSDGNMKSISVDGNAIGHFDLPLHFESSFDSLPEKQIRHDSFSISANESRTVGNRILFSGDVVILNNEFRIEADSASVVMSEDLEHPLRAVISGVSVSHFPSGSTVNCASANFEPSSGQLELSAIASFLGNELEGHDWANGDRLVFVEGRPTVMPVSTRAYASPLLEVP